MLDRLPAWLRHVIIMLVTTALAVFLPYFANHQADVTVWLVGQLRLPVWTVPLIASAVGALVLRFTTATRQYGVGSTNPPSVPVIADPPAPAAPLATGGTITAPSSSVIGDNGPEIVVPLVASEGPPPGAFGAPDPTPPAATVPPAST